MGLPTFAILVVLGGTQDKGLLVRLIKFSSNCNLEIRNIPPEWRKLFINARVTPKDLQDKETAGIIMSAIENYTGNDMMQLNASQVAPTLPEYRPVPPPTLRPAPRPPQPVIQRPPRTSNSLFKLIVKHLLYL